MTGLEGSEFLAEQMVVVSFARQIVYVKQVTVVHLQFLRIGMPGAECPAKDTGVLINAVQGVSAAMHK